MIALKWAVRIHKWLALVIGLQVFLWLLGGFVMSLLPIEKVRSEHKIAEHPPLAAAPGKLLSLEQAAAAAGWRTVDEATLTGLAGEPVWRLKDGEATALVAAGTGALLSPISEERALKIADHDFAPEVGLKSVRFLTDPPSEYGPGLPAWQVVFDDRGETRLYIDPQSGVVRARRSSMWRVFDFFWRLHVMDYDDGADFNHPLLIISAALGVMVAIAGLIILFFRMRRRFLIG